MEPYVNQDRSPNPNLAKSQIMQLVGLVLGFLAISGSLVHKQLLHHDRWIAQRESQYETELSITQRRADILDRNGLALAISNKAYNLYAIGSEVIDKRTTASRVAMALGMDDYGPIYERFADHNGFVWLARNIDPMQAARLEDIPGIGLVDGEARHYPAGELFAKIIGFSGVDAQGLEGAERYFDERLRGDEIQLDIYRDARQRRIVLEPLTGSVPLQKDPLRLSLDSRIQTHLRSSIQQFVRDQGARAVTALAMDPHTGQILGTYSWPGYNPNEFARAPREHWRNNFISDVFEPGSTFKLVTYAAALMSGAISMEDIFYGEDGQYRDGNRWIRDTHPMGWSSVEDAFTESSNVIATKVAHQMTPEQFAETIQRFGFGSRTGIELYGESAGILRPPDQWSKLSVSSLAMGYEIGVTALQMVRAYAAVANGGWLVEPTILPDDRRTPAEKILDERTARIMKHLLLRTVEEGTGKNTRFDYFSVCGKTGTAQKLDPVLGYQGGKYFASFIGFFPHQDPEVVMGIFVDEPGGEHYYGGSTAALIFRDAAARIMMTRGILPNKKPESEPGAP